MMLTLTSTCVRPFSYLLFSSYEYRNKFPPRSLLDLVDSKIYSRSDLLRRISSISLFKMPASSSLDSGEFGQNCNIWSTCHADLLSNDSLFVRAKVASGVPMLMATSSSSALLRSRRWGSHKHHPMRKKPSMVTKIARRVLRKQKAKKA
jgi:hypothetical protein